jgi:hypothetical protein
MKTILIGFVFWLMAASEMACSTMSGGSFGCAPTPPREGSACDLQSSPSWFNCWGDQDATPSTMYHCTDAGTWTYTAVACTPDPTELPCAEIAPHTLSCTYGSCEQGLTVAKCDLYGNLLVMHPLCDAGAD